MSKGSQPKHARRSFLRGTTPDTDTQGLSDISTTSVAATSPTSTGMTTATPTSITGASIADSAASSHATTPSATNSSTANASAAHSDQASERAISPEAQQVVDQIDAFDTKITQLRKARTADPDTLLDKLIDMAVPSVASLVAGKVFASMWDKNIGTSKKALPNQPSLTKELLFAACSAAFVAVVSTISSKSSRKFITRMQRRRKK